jgi:ABC-type nitrate/sulfonate/bicarbonate transport system substrate-binding protein/LysM repeat protein
VKTSANKKDAFLLSVTWVLVGVLTAARPSASAAADSSAPPALRKVVIGYSAIAPNQLPAWVAYEHGFFRKYGLDVQLIFVESGSRAVQTLISGDVSAAQVAGSAVLQSNLQGSGVVLIAGFINTLDYKFIVSRDITRPDQLKGKTVAVSRIGSSSDFATRYALEKYGLVPDKDVAILQIGSQPARFSALEAGKIHGVMIAIPLTAKAKKIGLNTLADLQMLGLEYQHTALAVSQGLIKKDPELVRNMLKSFVEAIHYMKTHRKESMAVLAKYLKTDDPDALEESYEAIGQALIPEKPYPTLKGVQIMLREMGAKDANARSARPEQFVDLSFIQQLDSSGFIDRLYRLPVAKASPSEPAPPAIAKAKPVETESKTKTVTVDENAKGTAKSISAPAEAVKTDKTSGENVASPSSKAQQYTVKSGDTLSKLADRFYNSVSKWTMIYEANRDTVKNPDYIYIGQKLIIPPHQAGT